MKLAIAQIVLGGLVVLFSGVSMVWGFPTEFTVPMPEPVPEGVAPFVMVSINPGPVQIIAHFSAYLAFVFGLAVLGCGIAQFLKSKGLKGAKP